MIADRLPSTPTYSVRRSTRARSTRLTISDAGEVVIVLPSHAADSEASSMVASHSAWIDRQLVKIEVRRRALALRPSLAAGRVLTINGQAGIVRADTADELARLQRRLRRTARQALEACVALRAAEMGITVVRTTVRDQRTRWGSASRRGTLSFNWRLVLCPPDVLDYVVVHELAHLRHAGHGRAFWGLVEGHHADPAGARRWLRENRDAVRHALD